MMNNAIKLRVLELEESDHYNDYVIKYIIVDEDEIIKTDVNDLYNCYGQKDNNYEVENGEMYVYAINYWDGRNHRSFTVKETEFGGDDIGDYDGTLLSEDNEMARKILAAYPDFERDYKAGVAAQKIDGFYFISSLYASDFALANVGVKW